MVAFWTRLANSCWHLLVERRLTLAMPVNDEALEVAGTLVYTVAVTVEVEVDEPELTLEVEAGTVLDAVVAEAVAVT